MSVKVNRAVLSNGLRVVHNYGPDSAMVTVDILYNVGARDEVYTRTGMAHLFEHLMFGGSVHVPQFDKVIEDAGGKNNAWTSNDFTNFYDILPAVNLETALYLESDRMLSLSFSPSSLEVQRSVVIEEFKQQCLNRPYGDLMHHLRVLLYGKEPSTAHPYAWPTIGLEPEHIARVTMDDVREWFFAHYAPNNAVLAICGGVEWTEALEAVKRWFGDIPRREIPPRVLPSPQFPTEDVIETIRGDVPTPVMVMAFPMARYGTMEYIAADAITDILSAGRASRLRRDLVVNSEDGLFVDVDASILGAEEEGFVMVDAVLSDYSPEALAEARRRVLESLRRLATPGDVSEYELERVMNKFESTFLFRTANARARAEELAMAEMHGQDINTIVAHQRSLTPDSLTSEARRLFCENASATLYYLPAEQSPVNAI